MLFQFQVTEANLVSPKERQGIYFKETGCLLECKGKNAAKPQEVIGSRNVKAYEGPLAITLVSLCVIVSCLACFLFVSYDFLYIPSL